MKILLLKNNVTDTATLDKGISIVQQWASTIGLNLVFLQVTTPKQFTSQPFSNETNSNGYIVNPVEIFQEAKTFGQAFDIACLVYDWDKITPRPTNPADNGQDIQIPIQWYVTYPEVFAEFFLHELCHYYFSNTTKPDITHFYDPRFSQKPRKDWYLYLLSTLITVPTAIPVPVMPTITLKRTSDDGIQTLGELSGNGFVCKTLERPWRQNMVNISCIPKGLYSVRWTFSLRLLRSTYEVQNVPNRAGIRLHRGNFFFDVDGCILLGTGFQDLNKDGKLDVINSTIATANFEQRMNKQPFMLQIT